MDPRSSSLPRRRHAALRALVLIPVIALVASIAALVPSRAPDVAAAGYSGWYKSDLHVHSVYSADARPDLGIVARNAAAAGYNAIFVTDHNLASTFEINHLTANHLVMEDSYTRWTAATSGSLSSSTNAFVTSPVHTGTSSLHLAATSSSAGQSFAWSTRGPNLASGHAMVKFSVYPKQLASGASLYMSASIGGDPSVKKASGYTTDGGVVSPGKSNVFVWYFGSPPAASLFSGSTVISTQLGSGSCDRAYATGAWITCSVDLNSALSRLATADQPESSNAWTDLKLGAASAGGTADGYFDTYSIDASAPVPAGNEFATRNASLSTAGNGRWDTSTLRLFPSIELGISAHSQRFNFAISDPAQNLWYQAGTDGIPVTQSSGYPAQLNHPGVPGGVTEQQAVDTNADGADLVEVRQPVMISTWDQILAKGVPMIGTWGTDNHNANWGSGSQATIINAPSMGFDALMRSLFEGRVFLANVGFSGHALLNLACGTELYPSRYPVFVSSQATSTTVCFNVTGGIASGSTVAWVSGGSTVATASASGAYSGMRTVSLSGATTYVRAEVRDSGGTQSVMSEPILFFDVAGLPSGMTFHVDGVDTPTGRDYTRTAVRGITQGSWDAAAASLTTTLVNPTGSLTEFEIAAPASSPTALIVGGTAVPVSGSIADFAGRTGSAWYFDAAARVVHVKASQTTSTTTAVVRFGGSTPTPTPTPTPTGTPAPTPTPTGSAPTSVTVRPVADAYVQSDQTATNYGSSTSLRVDGSPIVRSYLRFTVTGLAGTVTGATLRVYANTAQSTGYDVWRVADTSWGETALTYANAPAFAATKTGSSGPVSAVTWKTVDVTSLITGNGTYSLGLSTTGTTALSLASRESANGPQLVVTTSP